jgi:hypothetical protein
MTLRAWTVGLGLMLLAASASAVPAEESPKWEFEFLPYVWIPGQFGTLDVKGRTAPIDVSVRDGLELATSGNAFLAAGYLSASYDRWSAFVDAFGGYAEVATTQKIPTRFCTLCIAARADLRPVFVDFAVGYRLGQWALPKRRRPVTLGVYAGTRVMHFGAHLTGSASAVGGPLHAADVSTSFNWADPLIGFRCEVPLLDRVSFEFRGDIGGFGASSQFIWGLLGGVRYWMPWTPWSTQPWLGAGYRGIGFDRDFGAGNSLDLEFRGPYAGLGILF